MKSCIDFLNFFVLFRWAAGGAEKAKQLNLHNITIRRTKAFQFQLLTVGSDGTTQYVVYEIKLLLVALPCCVFR